MGNKDHEVQEREDQNDGSVPSSEKLKRELLEYQNYVDKCAICFSEKANLFISYCKDQLCVTCLEE